MKSSMTFLAAVLLATFLADAGTAAAGGTKLVYSTYLGGSLSDEAYAVAGTAGAMVVAGYTNSDDFPLLNAWQPVRAGDLDAFVSGFDSAGNLLFSTYLGGLGGDRGYAVGFRLGGIYLAGQTESLDFPTLNPHQAGNAGSSDAFLCLLNSAGSLVSSTYLGGGGYDYATGAAWEAGEMVIAGYTESTDFPLASPVQATLKGSEDAFVGSFGSDGSLQFSTYLGGSSFDVAYGAKVIGGEIWLAGSSLSLDFPTVSPIQAANAGEYDAFVCRFDDDRALGFSTYLGGSGIEECYALAAGSDSVWLAGATRSADFPTASAFQPARAGDCDAFVCRIDTSLALSFSTYFGGSQYDLASGISLEDGEASVIGYTMSADFPTADPVYPSLNWVNYDVFAASFSSAGVPVFSTYLGGESHDYGQSIARVDGRLILAGYTHSVDFPTLAPFQGVLAGTDDVFLTVLAPVSPTPVPTLIPVKTKTPVPPETPTPVPTLIPAITKTPVPPETPTPIPTLIPVKTKTPVPPETPTPVPTLIPVKTRTPIPLPTPKPAVIGDYNGDGTSDIALFRPSAGLWLVRGMTRVYFGSSTDFPVPQDYSGSGAWDIAIYRAAQSKWMARGVTTAWFGKAVDVPIPADYDGDGKADCAVFRPSVGKWAVRGVTQAYYGLSTDYLVPGNYAGDPRAQIAVWRASTGRWLVKDLTTLYYGGPTDGPVPGPYSGELSWDYAVYRYSQGKWLVRGLTQIYYGNSTDTVQPADYDGDGTFDFGVFRSSSGRWLVKGVTSAYYGASADEPVTNP